MTRTPEPRLLLLNVIAEQMETPFPEWMIAWLEVSLQAAIELESATMPPYLCDFWSIADKDRGRQAHTLDDHGGTEPLPAGDQVADVPGAGYA
jgi:hypothetical protein